MDLSELRAKLRPMAEFQAKRAGRPGHMMDEPTMLACMFLMLDDIVDGLTGPGIVMDVPGRPKRTRKNGGGDATPPQGAD